MAQKETIESLSKKIEMMQIQFDICDKHRRLAEEVVAEQRLRIQALEKENEGLRANVMILETSINNHHNPNDMETIMRLIAEKAELKRKLNAHQSGACSPKDEYAYLNGVSTAAKRFVQDLVNQGEVNLYHSIMSIMSVSPYPRTQNLRNSWLRFRHSGSGHDKKP